MLPFVDHQDRNLGDGGVQVVAREPGHASDAAVIHGSPASIAGRASGRAIPRSALSAVCVPEPGRAPPAVTAG
jgi:hypothetical protein